VCASRFAARKHFASDVVIGAAIGWFIGDFVYGRRHNQAVDPKSKVAKVLSHVHIGGPLNYGAMR
jgi:membrane-associated phospholipid phosphatase